MIEISCTQCFFSFTGNQLQLFLRSIAEFSRLLYVFLFVENLFLISERKTSPLTNKYMTAFIGILPLIYVMTSSMSPCGSATIRIPIHQIHSVANIKKKYESEWSCLCSYSEIIFNEPLHLMMYADLIFVKNFTRPDFCAKSFTH